MNTRLQVEHAVTEVVHGVDLVEWQVRVAAGRAARAAAPPRRAGTRSRRGCTPRIRARGFLPAAGTVCALALPAGAGIRVDAGIAAGETVGTRYDPMIAKVIAHGGDARQALARLREALRATTCSACAATSASSASCSTTSACARAASTPGWSSGWPSRRDRDAPRAPPSSR